MSDLDLRDLERRASLSASDFVRWARELARTGETRPLEMLRELRAAGRDRARWMDAGIELGNARAEHASAHDRLFQRFPLRAPAERDRALDGVTRRLRRIESRTDRLRARSIEHLRRGIRLARAVLEIFPGPASLPGEFDSALMASGPELADHLSTAFLVWQAVRSKLRGSVAPYVESVVFPPRAPRAARSSTVPVFVLYCACGHADRQHDFAPDLRSRLGRCLAPMTASGEACPCPEFQTA